jgi:hypothetical protein
MQVNILVEGYAEETFVKNILYPYLLQFKVYITPIIISSKQTESGIKFKGGSFTKRFSLFINDLKKLIYGTSQGYVTTFIDYYALPSEFPGYDDRLTLPSPLKKVEFLETNLLEYLDSPGNFIPYIQLHEFEAFLFADAKGFDSNISPKDPNLEELHKIIRLYPNPEDIDEGSKTAPSKRILQHYPSYDKVTEGNLILLDIGINTLLNKCPHFNQWVNKLKQLDP